MAALILVVDDNPRLLTTVGAALSTDDTEPVLALTVADALRTMQRGITPDAIVIDLDMRDGYEVLVELESEMEELVPVIALSSNPRRLIEAGVADAVVMKPFEVGQLRGSVHRACEHPRGAL
jgi:DNA-binding response OmpR family regulator